MKEAGRHIAYIVDKDANCIECYDKLDISLKLSKIISKIKI